MRQPPSTKFMDFLNTYGIFLLLMVGVIFLSIIVPIERGEQIFLTSRNLLQILLQASINTIIAVGMTFIITSGGIDLSVGSTLALSAIFAALAMKAGAGPWIGFLVAILGGALCGFLNGFLITVIGLSPFIATLGTMSIFRGMSLELARGQSIYGFNRDFIEIFRQNIFGVNISIIASVVISVIAALILTQTRFGKYTTAIGGNEEATKLAGIAVKRYKLGVYIFGGILTGVAATLLTARLTSADPVAGDQYELNAIAATIIGGTNLTGGKGTILGTVVGALVISLVLNGMNLLEAPPFRQPLIIGSVIIFSVILDLWRKRQVTKA